MAHSKEAAHDYYIRNREVVIARTNKHAKEHPEAHALYAKRWRERNPDQCIDKRRREKYGITTAEWDIKFKEQGECCMSCGTLTSGGRGWCTDHDHSCCDGPKSCGKCLRGIVCHACNVILGFSKDSPELLRKAADYIEKWRLSCSSTFPI